MCQRFLCHTYLYSSQCKIAANICKPFVRGSSLLVSYGAGPPSCWRLDDGWKYRKEYRKEYRKVEFWWVLCCLLSFLSPQAVLCEHLHQSEHFSDMFFLLSEALLPAGAAIVTTALHDLGPNWAENGCPKISSGWSSFSPKNDIRNLGYIPFQTHPHITNIMVLHHKDPSSLVVATGHAQWLICHRLWCRSVWRSAPVPGPVLLRSSNRILNGSHTTK